MPPDDPNPAWRDTPTGEWLRKFDNRCITQTIYQLKGQPRKLSGLIGGLLAMLFIGVAPAQC